MHELFVVTHPHAEHTERDLVGGWFDSRLTPRGRRDARLVARELCRRREEVGRPLRITTSDLERCGETARILADALCAELRADARLREISFGEAEGRPNAWLSGRQIPAPDDDRLDHRGPVPGAETRREVATRVQACVRELMADRDHDHVVVTHGRRMRSGSRRSRPGRGRLPICGTTTTGVTGRWSLSRIPLTWRVGCRIRIERSSELVL
nr:histidine phosphatase family protein [Rhodococcus sp. LB1]